LSYPVADNFDGIYADRDEDENSMWEVVGYTGENGYQKIIGNLPSKQLAEAFIRVYTDRYVIETFFDVARDC
jgi:hypothetical protein